MMFLFTRTMPFAYKEKCFKLIKFFQSENELNKFIQTTVGRNGLMVLFTISCEKLTKLVQLNEKPAVDAHGLPEHNGIYRVFLPLLRSRLSTTQSWYQLRSSRNRQVISFICFSVLLFSLCVLRTCTFCHCVSRVTVTVVL